MQVGKIPPRILRHLVLKNLGKKRSEVVVPAAFGEDSAVMDFGGQPVVVSTDPITAATEGAGRLAVIISCNDVAAAGAEPVGVLLTVILPEDAEPHQLETIMREAHEAAEELNVEIVGGHTEVVPQVQKPILNTTVIGKGLPDLPHWPITSSTARAGDALILTKAAAVEGTSILATDFREVLLKRGVKACVLEEAAAFSGAISVVEEARIAAQAGARAMHDATEGGVIGAAYEMAVASKKGIELYENEIPIANSTREICAALDLDPLRLISSGALLIAASPSDPILRALREQDIWASVIGQFTETPGISMVRQLPGGGQVTLSVTPPERDELWKALQRFPGGKEG